MNERMSALTVRVKLVNLDHPRHSPKPALPRSSEAHNSALVGSQMDVGHLPKILTATTDHKPETKAAEICLQTGIAIEHDQFEDHIEGCVICANRVELQLDFIETLEASLYQRQLTNSSSRVQGALLVSTPELNFAICGELET